MLKTTLILLISVLFTSEANDAFDGIDGLGQKNCPPHRCSKSHESIPKWPLKLTSSGCSQLGGGMAVMNQKDDQDSVIRTCCDRWNACFQTCGSTKSFCDEAVKKCMDSKCAEITDAEDKKKCDEHVNLKKILIQISDCRSFNEGQVKGCECVPSSEAPERRKKILFSFYKKFNPENSHKVDSLAAKANDSKKLAGLLTKLIDKYPEVVKSVEDPTQKYMEDLLKKGTENYKRFI